MTAPSRCTFSANDTRSADAVSSPLLWRALGGLLLLRYCVLVTAVGSPPLAAGMTLPPFAVVIGAGSGRMTVTAGPRWRDVF